MEILFVKEYYYGEKVMAIDRSKLLYEAPINRDFKISLNSNTILEVIEDNYGRTLLVSHGDSNGKLAGADLIRAIIKGNPEKDFMIVCCYPSLCGLMNEDLKPYMFNIDFFDDSPLFLGVYEKNNGDRFLYVTQ